MIHSIPVFVILTLGIMGGFAFMTGQALALKWRPAWQPPAFMLLLGLADRFLVYALFDGPLLSPAGYVLDTAVLAVIALAAHRLTLARRMAEQYPWLVERAGLFGWRERTPSRRP